MSSTQSMPTAPPSSSGAKVYFDTEGRRQRSRIPVPVNDAGEITAQPFECPRCHPSTPPVWKPLNYTKQPVCPVHPGQKMRPHQLKPPPLLPYREIWNVCERPLRPVWALPGMAAAGSMVDAAHIPALAMAATVPAAFEVTRRVHRWRRQQTEAAAGRLALDDPTQDKKLRAAIDAAARTSGYVAAAGAGWLTAVTALGLDPTTTAGKIAWTLALIPWLPAAATYWRNLRERGKPRVSVQEVPVVVKQEPAVDPEKLRVLQIWRTRLACHTGDIIGTASDGATPIKATANGKLAGASLTGWKPIRGGWKATIVGPPGVYDSDAFLAAKKKIASAFSVTAAMVSMVPDDEDENRCELLVQKSSVIREIVPWTGPDSVNAVTGLAPFVRYLDGSVGMYEIHRPDWGCPHDLFIGTTGSAKSSAIELALIIDRWAQHKGRGIVADFLIDPQEGQSFGTVAKDLAAPVATTPAEAMMLIRAFREEMLRRNRYLARKPWTDSKGRARQGAKSWDPLEDGPLLCLTIDEAHELLAIRAFAALVTAGGRMFRKCGMKLRIATHTPLLSDLGGSMALRDMLTGGFVWCGRTANGLSGPTAFNGRLPVDPKRIPEVPGAAYILSAREKKAMLARTMCGPIDPETGKPDLYDYVRDDDNNPIGYPAVLPPETLTAFGEQYADWIAFRNSPAADEGTWTPDKKASTTVKAEQVDEFLIEMVLFVLQQAENPLDMAALDAALREAEMEASVLAVREALAALRSQGQVVSSNNQHQLSPRARAELAAKLREADEQVSQLMDAEADA